MKQAISLETVEHVNKVTSFARGNVLRKTRGKGTFFSILLMLTLKQQCLSIFLILS